MTLTLGSPGKPFAPSLSFVASPPAPPTDEQLDGPAHCPPGCAALAEHVAAAPCCCVPTSGTSSALAPSAPSAPLPALPAASLTRRSKTFADDSTIPAVLLAPGAASAEISSKSSMVSPATKPFKESAEPAAG
jgi:hypothetical protein